jgi:ABC-type Zn uptake system ZnuABC Zn-binding protein ZnuA
MRPRVQVVRIQVAVGLLYLREVRKTIYLSLAAFVSVGLSACGSDDAATVVDTAVEAASGELTAESAAESAVEPGPSGDWYNCAGGPAFTVKPIDGGRRLQVVTTVAPITSIISNVAGDKADIRGVVPEGTNSHTFEPKPSVGKDLAQADLVFINGLKLEEPTKDLASTNLKAGAEIVELGGRTITTEEELYDFSFPKEGGKPNPHLWTNPPMAACYAGIAAQAMSAADPANAASYASNATAYIAKLKELDAAFRVASDTVPPGNRKLLTYHDAYAYFAKTYGWEVIGAIQVSSFEEPTAREVVSLINQVKETKVPAIFGSEVFPSPVLEQIGKEAGVKYVDVLRDDDLPGEPGDADHSFLGLMRFDYVTMVESLGGDAMTLKALDTNDVSKDAAIYPQ